MRFKFKTSIRDDVWNWHETLTKLGGYGQDWLRGWPSDLDKDRAKDKNVIKSYLYQNYYKDRLVQKYAAWMQVATNPEEVVGPLLKITGHKVPFDEVYVKITTGTRCPYDSDEGGFIVIMDYLLAVFTEPQCMSVCTLSFTSIIGKRC